MQLSIIIVNYNVRYFLEHCLYSVQAAIRQLQAEVWVVDNNSTDGSVPYLQPLFPWVNWLVNTHNPGFGAANNQAIRLATGEHILFLNPDTLLPEDCLEKCLTFLQNHSKAGALGIKMLDGTGRFLPESKRGFPSPFTSLFKLSGLGVWFPRSATFARYHLGHLDKNANNMADVLAGAFMLVRRTVVEKVGCFDERFFMYGEDIDLSYQIQQAGWQNWYFAESSIIHFKGESTKKGNLNYVRMFYQAMNLFVQKHYSGGSAFLYRWLIQVAIWGRAGVTLVASAVRQTNKRTVGKREDTFPQQLLLVASIKAFAGVMRLLQKNKHSTIHHCSTCNDSAKIIEAIHQYQPQQVVFCTDKMLLMKTVIEVMEKVSGIAFGFYNSQGQSIISSSSKNTSGQWLIEE